MRLFLLLSIFDISYNNFFLMKLKPNLMQGFCGQTRSHLSPKDDLTRAPWLVRAVPCRTQFTDKDAEALGTQCLKTHT